MENSCLVESLDSLWFFNNVFWPSNSHDLSSNNGENENENVKATPEKVKEPENENSSKPKIDSSKPKIDASEIEPEMSKPADVEEAESPRRRRRKGRSRSKRSSKHQWRKIFEEVDLCLEIDEVSQAWIVEENRRQNVYRMPPFDDNIAMKEHLKSWAYAVACTVK